MSPLNKEVQVFFALVRAGLWEQDVQLATYGQIDFNEVYRLAEEQSVVGLVSAGIEHVKEVKVPQEIALTFVGGALQLEQRNLSMNEFVAKLIEHLRKEDIYAILVKGQGIAQCYERPLWRASGDVDLLLSENNYQRAKDVLIPLADEVEKEYKAQKHIGMTLKGNFVVELHGSLHGRLSLLVNKGVDEAQRAVFHGGYVRSWLNRNTQVFLPRPDEDVIFVFTHILHHFFIDGIGLRQICDWCRLLWRYQSDIDQGLLKKRIMQMRLMTEWKAFAAFAVDYLGMPAEAMPFYSNNNKWSRKGNYILDFILESGNFGRNRKITYYDKYVLRKLSALWRKLCNFCHLVKVFPLDSFLFFPHFVMDGISAASRGE